MLDHRVEGTSIVLTINVRTEVPIERQYLERTLLQTHIRLRQYIRTHYHADQDVLFSNDDPYISDRDLEGCFFGVGHWPRRREKRLTYGMVDIVLRGIFDVLYREEWNVGADFYVVDDVLGEVGIGRVARDRPGNGRQLLRSWSGQGPDPVRLRVS